MLIELLGQRPVEGESPWASIEWHSNTCVCAARGAWRGVVAEYRLWCAMYWFLKPSDVPAPDLEATLPIIKGWYPTAVLRDLVECVTPAKVHELLTRRWRLRMMYCLTCTARNSPIRGGILAVWAY